MKRIALLSTILCAFALLLTCKKFDIEPITKVKTLTATAGATTASATGEIIELSSSSHSEYGFSYGTTPTATVADGNITLGTAKVGEYTGIIEGLAMGQQYYIRAYCKEGNSYVYGESKSFSTLTITITTTNINNITSTSASSGGSITAPASVAITARGVCWSTTQNPTIDLATKTEDPSGGVGTFTSSITGLTLGTTYYVRAYATHSAGTEYGNQISFTTLTVDLPTVNTMEVSSVTQNSFASGSEITSDGGSAIISRGVCWTTSANPTIALTTKTTSSSTAQMLPEIITNLTENTTYYVKAYATNSVGTAYGNAISFRTLQNGLASVTTQSLEEITPTTARCYAHIVSDNGSTVNFRGACWNTSPNPDQTNFKASNGSGIGSYDVNLTGLTPNTLYYVRAFAGNSVGMAYGNEITFTTQQGLKPTLSTRATMSITSTSVISGGNITSEGSSPVIERGVCWDINMNPTIALATKTVEAVSGIGEYPSSITELFPGTKYYVRAYATNSFGTTYGNELDFTTLTNPPTIVFADITKNFGDASFTLTPTSNSSGAFTYSCSDVSIATVSITGSVTILRAGTCTITVNQAATTNYSFGSETATLTVNPILPTVTTLDAFTNITSTSATSGGNVTSDGGATLTARGVCWSTTTNPVVTGFHTDDGSTIGTFTSSITGLSAQTWYYVKAYATNGVGTVYGSEMSFVTCSTPSATTNAPSSFTSTTATLSGAVNVWGGNSAVVTFEYGTTTSYGISVTADQSPVSGMSSVNVTSAITGLSPNTTYHYRVIAESCGTPVYGSDQSFTTTLVIGDNYQGGKVAYIFQSLDNGYVAGQIHGLIAALSDQSNGKEWSNITGTSVGPTSAALGYGQANSNKIINQVGHTSSAASICDAYTNTNTGTGIYSDWFLPSKDELNKLYLNKSAIGNFTNNDYWSSTEGYNYSAWKQNFSSGLQDDNQNKMNTFYVRAIRYF